MTSRIPKTRNVQWGFYGSRVRVLTGEHPDTARTVRAQRQAGEEWRAVGRALTAAYGLSGEQVREYLDSRSGRLLADAQGEGPNPTLPDWVTGNLRSFARALGWGLDVFARREYEVVINVDSDLTPEELEREIPNLLCLGRERLHVRAIEVRS